MAAADSDSNFDVLVAGSLGCESQLVAQYSDRLLRFACSRVPANMQARVDPADIVQSVFCSFFRRDQAGKFRYKDAEDVWRVLAAITFHKVQHSIRYHSQQMRDVRRDMGGEVLEAAECESPTASSLTIMQDTLQCILDRLPATHQRVLQLRLQGYAVSEIADELKISTRTVNRGLKLARSVAESIVRDGTTQDGANDDEQN